MRIPRRLGLLGVGLASIGVVISGLSAPASAAADDPLEELRNNVSITDGDTFSAGQLDSAGSSLRAATLADAGFGPGAAVQVGGIDFTMPDVAPGSPDNFTPSPKATTIDVTGQGNAIAFLGTAGAFSGLDLTVGYTDGSSQRLWVGMPAYTAAKPDPLRLSTIATTVTGRNTSTAADVDLDTEYAIVTTGVNIDPSKTVKSLTVASIGTAHLYDVEVVTVDKPFPVDSVLGRTPQPEDDGVPCDPRVEGQDACGPYNYWESADPSTHLRYFPASGVVPEGATAFYNEISVQSSAPGTYFMTNGYSGGYFGIQQLEDDSKIAIFSIFGPNKGTVPDDKLTSRVLYRVDHGDFVIHGEYAGGPSIRIPFDWQPGRRYATMITNQPVIGDDDHAQIVSAWLNTRPVGKEPKWIKLMTVKTERPAASPLQLSGLYSFVEDFIRDGSFTPTRVRSASYANAAIYRADTGWQPLNRIAFTGQLSGRYTIQNDGYPTAGQSCAITDKTIGGDIDPAEVRSGFGTLWDTSKCSDPSGVPRKSLAPLEIGAPEQQPSTFLEVAATLRGDQLDVATELLAQGEPVEVLLDGQLVSADGLTASDSGSLDTTISLTEAPEPGRHTVEVRGLTSNLTGEIRLD